MEQKQKYSRRGELKYNVIKSPPGPGLGDLSGIGF
jgi:hypothetical protein